MDDEEVGELLAYAHDPLYGHNTKIVNLIRKLVVERAELLKMRQAAEPRAEPPADWDTWMNLAHDSFGIPRKTFT